MKKIFLFGLLGIAAFGLVGTGAWYYDVETAPQNTFEAGTLDLKVNDSDAPVSIVIEDIAPGFHERYYWTIKNVGTICGQPTIEFTNIVDYENGQTEPETLEDATAGDPGPGMGELGKLLYTQLKHDGGSIRPVQWGDPKISNLVGPYGLGENGGTPIPVLCEGEETTIELNVWWDGRFSTPSDNKAQSDSVEFDIVFHLEQE